MNCNEVTAILDDGRMDKLDAEQRRQVEAHKGVCVVCARGWNAQAALAALPDLAMPAGLAMQCRAAVAAPRVERGRGGRKWLVGGSVAALAAAAAVTALLLRPVAPRATIADSPDEVPQVVAPVERSEDPSVAAVAVPTMAVEPPAAPRVTVRVLPPEVPPELREGATPATPLIFGGADLEMIRRDFTDPARLQARQTVYSAVVAELRKVPGLVLVNADPAEIAQTARHYRITVGMLISMQADLRVAPISSRYVAVALGAEQVQPGGEIVRRASSSLSVDLQGNCVRMPGSQMTCVEMQSAVRDFVNKLRQETFPPDASITRPLFAKLEDPSLDVAQRLAALKDLYNLQTRTGETGMLHTPGVVQAIIDLARLVTPEQRAQLWRTLRGVGDPALLDSLLASLVQDPEEVRIAAIETLGAGFSGDARVRSALEAAAAGDSRPLVRAVADRALAGEASWQRYMLGSLKDSRLPPAQRIEALAYYLYPPKAPGIAIAAGEDPFTTLKPALDEEALRAIAEVLPHAGNLSGNSPMLLTRIGYSFSRSPVVTSMLLDVLENDTDSRNRTSAGEVLARTQVNDPKVRAALVKAIESDPDAHLRTYVRQVMGDKAP
jgi:hypothetical protein